MHSLIFLETLCLFIGLFLPGYTADDEILDETARHAATCDVDDWLSWSYRGSNGPEHWGELYPACHGLKQSPISIDSGRVDSSLNIPRMDFYYSYMTASDYPYISNEGHTVQLHFPDNQWRGVIVNYRFVYLQEIHFHWGSNKDKGSEHVVDGVRYPMEMHLVHRNENENITAVVAVFFEEDDEINAELQHIVNELPKVMYRDSMIQMSYRVDVQNLMPENPAAFYLYEGSLTTPDCTEGVIWIVLKAPNHVGHAQMREFRKLFSAPQHAVQNGCRISNNFRPVQHLHRRKVYTSV